MSFYTCFHNFGLVILGNSVIQCTRDPGVAAPRISVCNTKQILCNTKKVLCNLQTIVFVLHMLKILHITKQFLCKDLTVHEGRPERGFERTLHTAAA